MEQTCSVPLVEPPAHARAGWRPWVRQALVVVAVGYSALHLAYSVYRYNVFDGLSSGDFLRSYQETQEWRHAETLNFATGVAHPPFYYLLMWPLSGVEFKTVALVVYFAQFLVYPLAIVWMAKIAATSPTSTPSGMDWLLVTVLTVNFHPFLETLASHKIEGLEFVLICAALYALKRGRDLRAGALTTLAANLKYLPGLLGIYFVVKRRWRVVLGMVGAFIALLFLLWPVFGSENLRAFLGYPLLQLFAHRHEGTRLEASMEFQTLSGMVNRWFSGRSGMLEHLEYQAYIPVPDPALAATVAMGLKALLAGLYLWVLWRRWPDAAARAHAWRRQQLEISLTLIMIFILAQASRVHYAILLLPAFVMVGLLLAHDWALFRWPEKLLFVAAYALTGMLIPGGLLNRLPPHPLWGSRYYPAYLWLSLPFYGYLVLGLCIIVCAERLRRGTPAIPVTTGDA